MWNHSLCMHMRVYMSAVCVCVFAYMYVAPSVQYKLHVLYMSHGRI